jgi:hypothetical protein
MSELDIDKLPGLKHRDFKPCLACGKGVMHAGSISFYRVRIEHCVVNTREVEKAAGMEMLMGNPQLANVMGPDADLAKVMSADGGLLCQDCGLRDRTSVAGLFEIATERNDATDDVSA